MALPLCFFGCKEDTKKIVAVTNALYLDIKSIVTDPDIKPMIQPGVIERLEELEHIYLSAANSLKEAGPGDTKPATKILIACADEVLSIICNMAFDGAYDKQIAAIRLSIKILQNHLQIE